MNPSDGEITFVSCAQAVLFVVAIINVLVATRYRDRTDCDDVVWTNGDISNLVSFAVCVVSGVHYTHILNSGLVDAGVYRGILYSDWLVTVPLLMVEFWLLLNLPTASVQGRVGLVSVVLLSIGMIVTGLRRSYWMSWACLLLIYAVYILQVNTRVVDDDHADQHRYPSLLVVLFFALWMLYGVVEMVSVPFTERVRAFALLDILCKAVFGVTIAAMA